jgi:hypothetical protein
MGGIDADNETLNREAAYGEDGLVRDDRNLIEKARDAMAGSPNRTRPDAMYTDAVRVEAVADSETGIAEPPAGPEQVASPALSAPAARVESSGARRDEADLAAATPSGPTATTSRRSGGSPASRCGRPTCPICSATRTALSARRPPAAAGSRRSNRGSVALRTFH